MIDADDIDDGNEPVGKSDRRLVDRVSNAATLLYSVGLGAVGIAIIVIGIVGAFHH